MLQTPRTHPGGIYRTLDPNHGPAGLVGLDSWDSSRDVYQAAHLGFSGDNLR